MTLIVENVNKDLEKAIKAMARLANAKVRNGDCMQSKTSLESKSAVKSKGGLKAALKEYKNDKKAGKIKTYDSFEEFEKDLLQG
ncbi:hypothetical protein DCO58_04065 [Helicobacter saguini]|uniref:Uncharacterized protein n=1 Tax=Helicobacter saguini TaxID=1548018 RepID=A0A347VSK5_9HELI|nr:hypothetical protein [Helicobacter saguini]MWV62468.1 hypothetical protein [Helicobacter saguini]MWV66859.1 hypothetical protein [Helicobacter saguini]MWV69208.1 hypothetical protein [Helicobacter saguini]MWV71237.1 hypothetical protein [Helicobacter saguini]TLD93295.1 hypothetical protein LS64_008605 [Helicobacter saguini]